MAAVNKVNYDAASWQAAVTGVNLTPDQRALRDAFVRQYVVDFNGSKALVRCGCPCDPDDDEKAHAKKLRSYANRLCSEPYVAVRLHEMLGKMRETDVVTRNQVLARVWEEANCDLNSGKERIAALALIAKMLGMLKDLVIDKPETQTNVMLVPVMSADQWEHAAAASQLELKARAVTPSIPPPLPPQMFVHSQS